MLVAGTVVGSLDEGGETWMKKICMRGRSDEMVRFVGVEWW